MSFLPASPQWPPVVGILGHSGSGKTLLIERLVPRLGGRGLRVAVVKHCTHHIDADRPGKDSDRIFRSGAEVLAVGPGEAFLRFGADDASLAYHLDRLSQACDVVLVEGFREMPFSQIRLRGKGNAIEDGKNDGTLLTLVNVEQECLAAEQAVWDVIARAHAALPVYAAVVMDVCGTRKESASLCAEVLTILERSVTAPRVLLVGPGPFPEGLPDVARLPAAAEVPGAMASVLSAMRWQPRARWIVLTCDPALARPKAVEWLLSHTRPGVDAVLPGPTRFPFDDPLFAAFEPTVRPALEQAASQGQWSLRRALSVARVLSPELPPSDPGGGQRERIR